MSRRAKSFGALASILAFAYLALSLFAISCAFDHVDPAPAGHHHGGTISHSSSCAWACQANPTSDAGPVAFSLQPFFVAALVVERSHSIITGGGGFYPASRAPPFHS